MKYDKLTRRMFLQGAGKSYLAIPFLRSLAPAFTLLGANSALAAGPTLKYIAIHSDLTNPFETSAPDYFDIRTGVFTKGSSAPWNNAGSDGIKYQILQEIVNKNGILSHCFDEKWNSYLNDINIISNTHSYVTGGSHNSTVFSCASGPANQRDYGTAHFHYSSDQVAAEALYGSYNPSLPIIHAGLTDNGMRAPSVTEHWEGSHNMVNGEAKNIGPTNLMALYNTLVSYGGSNTGSTDTVNPKKKIVDLVLADYQSVTGSRYISSDDKATLSDVMDQWNDLSKILEANSSSNSSTNTVSCSYPGVSNSTNFNNIHNMTMKMTAIALSCGVSNIIDYSLNDMAETNIAGERESYHRMSHENHININGYFMHDAVNWRAGRVLDYIKILKATPDVNGKSVFENTVLTWNSEYSTRGHIPLGHIQLIASGNKDLFDLGQHVNANGAPTNKLFVTSLKALGLTTNQIERNGSPGFGEYNPDKGQTTISAPYMPSISNWKMDYDRINYDTADSFMTTTARRAAYHFLKG